MCVVSNVGDHYQRQWGNPWDKSPLTPSISGVFITQQQWEEYQRLKQNAQEIDKLTQQPDCRKPEFEDWEKRMEEFLKQKGILK